MPNCRKTRFLGLSAYCAFNCAYWSSRDCAACSALSGCGLQGPVDVTHWQFVQCLSHRPHHFIPREASWSTCRSAITSTPGNHQIGFQRDNAFQIHPLPGGNLLNLLRLWRIVGIAADPNRRDPGGKGKFSVGGRKRDDARRGVSHSGARKDRATSA